jgi:hypothetical protein
MALGVWVRVSPGRVHAHILVLVVTGPATAVAVAVVMAAVAVASRGVPVDVAGGVDPGSVLVAGRHSFFSLDL